MISRFLSAVTGISKDRFLNAEYIGGELIKGKLSERGKIADIIIKLDEEDETCIVEMNKYDTGDILEKNLSYAYSVFNEKTRRGIRKWPKVILINIDNFNKFNADEPIIELEMRDKNNKYKEKLKQKKMMKPEEFYDKYYWKNLFNYKFWFQSWKSTWSSRRWLSC